MPGHDDQDIGKRLQQAGLLTSIPFVLLAGPAIGYYLGNALDARWPHAPWGIGVGTILGASGSCVQVYRILRWIATAQRNSKTGKS
ncbi:MAG: AtpZ/AtpI family protein [Candidatus Omnitrophica bacterium]|nr:AtpZ/AtpI family protein [Candidatus Omnitrophota bacterium]